MDRGAWTAKTVKRPRQQPAQPQYANYWAPLMRKRHTMPHPAQPQHTNHWAPRTRKQHQQKHRPQRPTESSNLTQHAKGRTGDCPGPRKEATTRRNVTQGGRGALEEMGPQRWPQKRLDRRLEGVAEVVGGGYCWLQMPLRPALAIRETVAGHRLGGLEGGAGVTSPPFQCIPRGGGGVKGKKESLCT